MLSDYIPGGACFGCYHLGMLTAGFVLAGGQSRRMGQNKALLPWKAGVLVQEVCEKLAAVLSAPVTLVGHPSSYSHLGYPCIPDLRPGLGPLSGIETALASSNAELNLILACDMPHIETAHLCRLLNTARHSAAKCLITADASGIVHPLCAVYRKTCLPAVQSALDEQRFRLLDLVHQLQAETIPTETRLENVNTLDDWSALRAANG